MLKLNNVEIVYHDVILVVKGISLEVAQGSMVALLGNNGAGKSTTLKAISRVLDSEDGEIVDGTIHFMGTLINNQLAEKVVRLGISQVPEGRRVFDELTVEENLKIGAYIRSDKAAVHRDLDKVLDFFPVLRSRRNDLSVFLSGGEQQMIAIGRALMSGPKLLMLDEPSLGLAPIIVEEIFGILRSINGEENVSVLLVEQNASIALELAGYGYIMENGKIVLDGPSDKLAENPDVKEFYLGLTEVGQKKSYRDVKHYKRRKRWLS